LGTVVLNVAVRPPAGAGPEIVNVPVELAPPVTVLGFIESETRVGAVTVRVADPDWPFADAPMLEVELLATATVVTVNVAVVEPPVTVTDAGTVATLVTLDVSVTVWPAAAAGLLRVTVPVEGVPPGTDAGLSVTPVTVGGLTVNVAV
jgi:hypothetical protein